MYSPIAGVSSASAGDAVSHGGRERCEGASNEIKVVQRKHGVDRLSLTRSDPPAKKSIVTATLWLVSLMP